MKGALNFYRTIWHGTNESPAIFTIDFQEASQSHHRSYVAREKYRARGTNDAIEERIRSTDARLSFDRRRLASSR